MRKLLMILLMAMTIFSCKDDDNSEDRIIIAFESPSIVINQNEVKEIKITCKSPSITNPVYELTIADKTIAKVKEGCTIEGLNPGKTTLTAKIKGLNVSETCELIVKKIGDVTVDIESITLNYESLEMLCDENELLVATILPENATSKEVIWSSSDETIATVDQNGKVTAISSGKVEIYVKTLDGSISAKCDITISNTGVTEIQFTNAVEKLIQHQEYKLEYTTLPTNIENAVNWTSSDESVATVNEEGIITALSSGYVTITATLKTDSEVKAEIEINIIEETYQTVGTPMTFENGMIMTVLSDGFISMTYQGTLYYYFYLKIELPADAESESVKIGEFTGFNKDRVLTGTMSELQNSISRGETIELRMTATTPEADPITIIQYSCHENDEEYNQLETDGLKWKTTKDD